MCIRDSVPPVLVVAPPLIGSPKGPIAPKFEGGERRCVGLADAYHRVCQELGCHFFDSNTVITSSKVDGVHLDVEQHFALGTALSQAVASLLHTDMLQPPGTQ